jgi:hypothetical protein
MRISFVTSDAGGGNVFDISDAANTTGWVTWPSSSIQPGDFALIGWVFQNTGTATNPSGIPLLNTTTNGNQIGRLFGKVCDGTETGNIPFVHTVQNKMNAFVAIYRGAHKTTPVQAGDISVFSETVLQTTHQPAAVTLPVSDCAVIVMCSERASPPSTSYTQPSGYTERIDTDSTFTNGTGGTIIGMADDGLATDRKSGTVVTPGVYTGQAASGNAIVWTVAVRPREYEGWGVDL